MSDSCEFFLHNPAQPLYSQALALSVLINGPIETNEAEAAEAEIIEKFESAISLGLPEDDESYAKFTVGESHFQRAYRLSPENTFSPEFSRGLEQMEKAVSTDSQKEYGIFSQPIHQAQLRTLAAAYLAVKDSILKQKDIDVAIAYIEEKLHLFDYLSNPPLLLILGLGELYVQKGDMARARQTFRRILQAPILISGDEHETNVRKAAEKQLESLESKDTKRSGCFIATAVYGQSNSPEIELLQRFRDKFLMTRLGGRLFVSYYYRLSPPIARLIDRSEFGKELMRRLLLRPILWLIKRVLKNRDMRV